jgi:hypothetical protein
MYAHKLFAIYIAMSHYHDRKRIAGLLFVFLNIVITVLHEIPSMMLGISCNTVITSCVSVLINRCVYASSGYAYLICIDQQGLDGLLRFTF